jgi:ATP-binding cassette subfamily B protein
MSASDTELGDDQDVYRCSTASEVLRFLGSRLRPWRWQTAAILLMVVLRVTLGAAGPICVIILVDTALPRQDTGLLFVLCAVLLVSAALTSALSVGEAALSSWLSQRLVADLRKEVFDKTQGRPLGFFTGHAPSELQTRLVSDLNGVDRFISQTLRSAIAAFTSGLTAAAVMVYVSWPLALISLSLTVLLALLNNQFAAVRRGLARERQQKLTELTGKVADTLSLHGVLLGRTLAGSERQRGQYLEICEDIRKVTVRQRVIGARTQTFIGFCFSAIPPIIYLLSGTLLQDLSVGMVMALVLLQMRLADPMMTLLSLSAGIQSSMAMFDRVMEYTGLPYPTPVSTTKAVAPAVGLEALELHHRYPGADRPALDSVDLDIEPGTVNIILGATGSGKSTLAMVLAGLVDAGSGTVSLGGTPVPARALPEHVTLVPQHTTFFSDSIRENLAFARETVSEPEMAEALRAACLEDLIDRLPLGLDTRIGQGGYRLSGGERQRLSIARALLCGGRVLILDEATSALDGLTAQRVMDRLRTVGDDRTLVVICHRIPRLDPTDRVVVMDAGRITEQGSAGELDTRAGAYAALVEAQNVKTPMEGAPT